MHYNTKLILWNLTSIFDNLFVLCIFFYKVDKKNVLQYEIGEV